MLTAFGIDATLFALEIGAVANFATVIWIVVNAISKSWHSIKRQQSKKCNSLINDVPESELLSCVCFRAAVLVAWSVFGPMRPITILN